MPDLAYRILVAGSLLGLAPGSATAQQSLAPADSAHRLDSLASALSDQATPDAQRRAATIWLQAEEQAMLAGKPRLAATMLWSALIASQNSGDQERCIALGPRTIDRVLAIGDSVQAARAANQLGLCHSELQHYSAARETWLRGLALMGGAGELQDPGGFLLANLAVDRAARGRPDSVLPLTRRASAAHLATGDTLEAFQVWYDVGYTAAMRPDTSLAISILVEGLRHREEADSSILGNSWFVLGRMRLGPDLVDSAIQDFQRGLAAVPVAGDRDLRASLWTSLGDALFFAHRPREALRPFEQAVAIASNRGSWSVLALALRGLAGTRESLGDYRGAQAAYANLANAAEAHADTAAWALALKQEGGLLGALLNQPAPALGRFHRALTLARATHMDSLADSMIEDIASLGLAGGVVPEMRYYLRQDADSQHAIGHLRAAALSRYWVARLGQQVDNLAIIMAQMRTAGAEAAAGGDVLLQASTEALLGKWYNRLGQADSARVLLGHAVRVTAGRRDEVAATALLELGVALGRLGQLDSALVVARRGLAIARLDREGMTESSGLEVVADIQRARGTPAALREAVASYDSAVGSLERWYSISTFRRGIPVGSDLMGKEFGAVMAWLGLAPTIGEEHAARGALLALERSRGLVIRQLRTEDRPPESAEKALRTLRQRRAAMLVSTWATNASAPHPRDTLVTLVVDTAGQVHSFVRVLPPDSVAAMLWGIREVCCLTSADSTRSGVAGTAGPGGTRADPRGSLQRLSRTVLTDDVLAKFAGAREILLEPDLSLSIALFAAAPVGKDGQPFGLRYPFRYLPALTLGVEKTRPATGSQALVVGDPTMPTVHSASGDEVTLPPLPGARAEAAWVAKRLGSVVLSGDAATETEIRRRLGTASIIHLATHGLAYRSASEPRAPFIALAPDSLNDGVLSLRELLNDPSLRLQADLVVLSACQSGLGEISGEGNNGLQRAFLARGARSVIYSLWNVSDEATALFMQRFYQHWLDDRDRPGKSEALRRAREDVRADPRFHAPRFWAAFQLAGAD